MPFRSISFPQYPEFTTFIAYYKGIKAESLTTVKSELIQRNSDYDYCFLSTTHIISMEQLQSSIHKSIQNFLHGNMKAKSLNTEILFNLSPVNNINDALKRFGIDEKRSDVIVVKVCLTEEIEGLEDIHAKISGLLDTESLELNDQVLESAVVLEKFKKLYKLSEKSSVAQQSYAKVAVATSLLRGL